MSYATVVHVACDEPGCEALLRLTTGRNRPLSKTWAGYLASTDHGWYTLGHGTRRADPKVAYCPLHKGRAARGGRS